jgi:RHS repeat-associated protein
MTQDNHKSLSISYNYLNLPSYVSNTGGSDITLTYTADGEKLSKVSSAGTRNYVSGIEYLGTGLEEIYHGEGRCTPNGATAFYYEYTIKDHLGNARVNFRANGAAVTFLQELHYYPFGMLMEGLGAVPVTNNGYKYNGKELNEDLGLNWSDYGARWYDAALGRWWSVDPLAEKFAIWSGYNYGVDNPVRFIDPDGRNSESVTNEYKIVVQNGQVQSVEMTGTKGGNQTDYVTVVDLDKVPYAEGVTTTEVDVEVQYTSGVPNDRPEDQMADPTPGLREVHDKCVELWAVQTLSPAAKVLGIVGKVLKNSKGGSNNKNRSGNSKNERHGDAGRALKKADKQVQDLLNKANSASSRKERKKLEQKARNVREDAARKAKGVEHSNTKKT